MIKRNSDKESNQKPVKQYWRSFDQMLGSKQLDQVIDHDFGAAAPPPSDGFSRRRWLQLMGASMAFGSLAGCRFPEEKIVPFAFRPQGRTPGIPDSYSTMLELGGIVRPLVATCVDGRPIKLDGNPDHPDSLGSSDVFTQATILEMYDPDRSRSPARRGSNGMEDVAWDDAINTFKSLLAGSGVAVLAEPCSSPTQHRLKKAFLDSNSSARWFEFASVSTENSDEGARKAFGEVHRPIYRLADAKVIVTIDSDPLGVDPATSRLARDFAKSRDADHGKMSRMYSVESDFSATGAMADHRIALRFGQIDSFLAALEALIDSGSSTVDPGLPRNEKILAAMAEDLLKDANRGASAIIVGATQPADVHARAFRINSKLGNLGKTVLLQKPADPPKTTGVMQLKELTGAMVSGQISTLLILGGNPVFTAPSDLDFATALSKVTNTAHFSLYRDETSRACEWHLNAAHPLTCWGDGRSYDGSICISQPLINPLYGGRSAIQLLAELTGQVETTHSHEHGDDHGDAHGGHHEVDTGLAMVKETVKSWLTGDNPESAWQTAVKNGFIEGTAVESADATVSDSMLASSGDANAWKTEWSGGEPELIFRAKNVYDGRFANNGWLQELPDFITKLTWDNAALVNPVTAEKLGLTQGKLANFQVDENRISLPVYILPGLPNGTICTWLGYGRDAAGRVAGDADYSIDTIGNDIRPLRTSGNWWSVPAVIPHATSTSYLLATTQDHFEIDQLGRDEINQRMAPGHTLVRGGTFDNYQEFLKEHPIDEHGHDHAAEDHSADDHADDNHVTPSAEESADGHSEDDHGDDGHGHHHSWPTGHHMHFKNFDLTRAGWLDEEPEYRWGMGIDLNKCTGCNSCVIACQAENNIPVVGKDQVSRGREMQWMRIDRYFITEADDKDGANVEIAHQPLTCQHCEKAPCETVCPVAATTHSDEGLNDMVYNRCIGTRYCGNNCPYKVRRFNYYNYTDAQTFIKIPGADRLDKADLQLQGMMMNPEVTIRSRGVMEKCTYCVQRIQNVKIKARTEGNRRIEANEVRTACQDACPTQAITFGDIANTASDVHKAHQNPRSYALLEELNIYPRTKYLARVTNPHPALVSGAAPVEAH